MTARPDAGRPRPLRAPRVAEDHLDNGLRVFTARRRGVPMVELRLRLPGPGLTAAQRARLRLLTRSMLAGTTHRSDTDLARAIQATGGQVTARAGFDAVTLAGSALAGRLDDLLALLGEVLTGASYPASRVRNQRTRLMQELIIQRSRPQVAASELLGRQMYGRHPYGLGLPRPDAVARTGPGALRSTHPEVARPGDATLVVVGDVPARRVLDAVRHRLEPWAGGAGWQALTPPRPRAAGPVRILDRPGSVQTNIRIGGPAPGRADPGYAAFALANLAYGGYFASRLVQNVREDKGYSYSPRSTVDHFQAASRVVIAADVATEVTGPALIEIGYELNRLVAAGIDDAELELARRYRIGTLAMAVQTQAGLASQLHDLLGVGLDGAFLHDHTKALDEVDGTEVLEAARTWLRPPDLITTLVGDAARIVPQVEPLGPVEVVS